MIRLAGLAARLRRSVVSFFSPSSGGTRHPALTLVEAVESRMMLSGDPFPGWLDPGSIATWTASSRTLLVTDHATFTGDPGAVNAPHVIVGDATHANASLTIAPTDGLAVHLAGLALANHATASLESLGAERTALHHRVLIVAHPLGISIDAHSTLDLTDNALIVDYADANDNPAASITELVGRGYGSTAWDGTGITSSVAAVENSFALAPADNVGLVFAFGSSPGAGGELFAGQDVDDTAVLVKYTLRVDLNLDGVITPTDATIFGSNFDPGQEGSWPVGDLDYDGIFTPNDETIFGTFYEPSPAPQGTTELDATASGTHVTLTWNPIIDATSYNVYRIANGEGVLGGTPYATGITSIDFIDTNLVEGTTYTYAVRAVNAVGESTLSVANAADTVPATPTGLWVDQFSGTELGLSWDDNSMGERGTRIERSLSGSTGWTKVADVGPDVTSYLNGGLQRDTTYHYRVTAFNDAGESSSSNTADNQTLPPVPTQPFGLSVTGIAPTEVRIDWLATSTTNEDGFIVERALWSDFSNIDPTWDEVGRVGTDVTSYTDATVEPGREYVYRVFAFNKTGTSTSTSWETVISDLPVATDLSLSDVGGSGVAWAAQLNWSYPEGASDGFFIETRSVGGTWPGIVFAGEN